MVALSLAGEDFQFSIKIQGTPLKSAWGRLTAEKMFWCVAKERPVIILTFLRRSDYV